MKRLSFYYGILKDVGLKRTLKLAGNYLRAIGNNEKKIVSTSYIELSSYCERNCKGCYVEGKNKKETIDVNVANKFIKQVHNLGSDTHVLVGGEPTEDLTKNILYKIIEGNPKDVFYICSNGFNIDEETAKKLSKYNNLVVSLSIDGFMQTNDYRRGDSSFDKFIEASYHLRKNKLPLGTYITVNSRNFEEVSSKDFVEFLISMGMKFAGYQMHFGNSGLSPSVDQYVISLKRLHELAQKSPITLLTPHFGDLKNPSLKNRHKVLALDKKGGVKVGRSGKVRGDIKKESLEEIMKKPEFVEDFKKSLLCEDERSKDYIEILERVIN